MFAKSIYAKIKRNVLTGSNQELFSHAVCTFRVHPPPPVPPSCRTYLPRTLPDISSSWKSHVCITGW